MNMLRFLKKVKSRIRAFIVLIMYLLSTNIKKDEVQTRVLLFHHIDSKTHFNAIVVRLSKLYNCISFNDWLNGKVVKDRYNVIILIYFANLLF